MTYRDKNLEGMLLKMAYDDKALSYVLKVKAEVEEYADRKHPRFMDEAIDYYLRILADVKPVTCSCCGLLIKNVRHRGDLLLGVECIGHPDRFPCHSLPPSSTYASVEPASRATVDLEIQGAAD